MFVSSLAIESPSAAMGDRTLSFYNLHTQERLTVTYKRNGAFDAEGLRQINHILRDWRRDETIQMDRRLIDLVWEVYQASGSRQPINIICGYRAPATNSMLRSRSNGVAENSQHMGGKALDFALPDVPLRKLRDLGLQAQIGGVGYYPGSGSPFVHLDVGSVRHWPRMSRDQLVQVFPQGHTLHIPSDGRPLPGYQEAQAAYRSRGSGATTPLAGGAEIAVASLFAPAASRNPVAATAPAAVSVEMPIPPAPRPAPNRATAEAPVVVAAAAPTNLLPASAPFVADAVAIVPAAPATVAAIPPSPAGAPILTAALSSGLPATLLDLPPVPRRNPAAGPAPARSGVTLASATATALPAAKPAAVGVMMAYAAPGAAGPDPLRMLSDQPAPTPVAAVRPVAPPVPTPQPNLNGMFAVAWGWDDRLAVLSPAASLEETTLPVLSVSVTTRQRPFARLTLPDTGSLAAALAMPERTVAAGFGRVAAYGDMRTDRFSGTLLRTVALVDLDDLSDRTITLAAVR